MPARIDGYPVGLPADETNSHTRPITILVGPTDWLAGGLLANVKGATGLPMPGTKARDVILRESVLLDGMWAAAVNMAITKQVALGYQLTALSAAPRQLARSQRLVQTYWPIGLSQGLRDYLTTGFGMVIGLQRSGTGPGARIDRLVHLDSVRCYATNRADYPVLYETPAGEWRLLADYDVIHLMDMPDPRNVHMGLCAADRAWETILKLCAMETYYREKVSGSRNLAIHIINGISDTQLADALTQSDESQRRRGFVLYRGSTIIPTIRTEAPTVVTIPLAEIPDGFNVVEERRDAYLRIANALGVFIGEIQPLSGQGLGTGTQTVILSETAAGRGMAAWQSAFVQQVNDRVLPFTISFSFTNEHDVRDRKMRAEADRARIEGLSMIVAAGAITPAQMANVLADEGIVPKEFVPRDMTASTTLNVGDKPEQVTQDVDAAAFAEKALAADIADTSESLIAEEWQAARRWAATWLTIDAHDETGHG